MHTPLPSLLWEYDSQSSRVRWVMWEMIGWEIVLLQSRDEVIVRNVVIVIRHWNYTLC